MNNDDILQMARESGLFTHKEVQPELLRFARLVAEAEREACAKVCEKQDTTQYPRTIEDEHFSTAAAVCAAAIRARGEA